MTLPKQNDIISYWKGNLDENGLFHDFVGSNHGTLVSAPPQVETPYGSALDFDGSADSVTIAHHDNFSFGNSVADSPFTISAIVRMDDASGFHIFTKGSSAQREYAFGTRSSDDKLYLILYYDDSSGTVNYIQVLSASAVTNREKMFTHYTAVYNGGGTVNDLFLYENGKLLAITSNTNGSYIAMHNHGQNAVIARFMNDVALYSDGIIGHTIVKNTALNPNEVLQEYNYLQRLTAKR